MNAADFVAEYKKLQLATPRLNTFLLNTINSDYCYNCENVKDSYLIANAVEDENCMYGRDFYGCKDCTDCDHVRNCTLCYQCLNSGDCYNSDYLQDCANCSDCRYGYYMKGCQNCVGCVGLKQRQYCIFNEQYSKADFEAKVASLSDEEIRVRFEELKVTEPRVALMQIDCENVAGNSNFHCRNVYGAFDASECEDSGYLLETKKLKDCWDITILEGSQLCYQVSSSHVMYNCNFCFFCVECRDCEYGECLMSCSDCFGCVSLHRKQYHILNVAYSAEEYFRRVAEIKAGLREMGVYGQQILPSCFPRVDTVAEWDRM